MNTDFSFDPRPSDEPVLGEVDCSHSYVQYDGWPNKSASAQDVKLEGVVGIMIEVMMEGMIEVVRVMMEGMK